MLKCKNEHKIIYLIGDFNIDILNITNHIPSSEFLETLYTFSLCPLINKPTRVSSTAATLIDNIYFNDVEHSELFNGILYTDISDHFLIFSIHLKVNSVIDRERYITVRRYDDNNIYAFCQQLTNMHWTSVYECSDCQSAYSLFHECFMTCYNECFPLRSFRISTYRGRKSWLTQGLKVSIKMKNKLLVRSRKTPSVMNIKKYKIYRNKLNHLLRYVERRHYDSILQLNKHNLRKTWMIIKEVINKKKHENVNTKFNINGSAVSDCNIVANKFNEYFVNTGPSLAVKISLTNDNPINFIKNSPQNSLYKMLLSMKFLL